MLSRARLWIFVAVAFTIGPLVSAQRVVDMPQTEAFREAFETAQKIAAGYPSARVVGVASTYSMYPVIDWDAIVILAPVPFNRVRVGDVISFRDDEGGRSRTILHRVKRVFITNGRLVTRGDSNERDDPHPVTPERLVGKVVAIVYFDRGGEVRPVKFSRPTPRRTEPFTIFSPATEVR